MHKLAAAIALSVAALVGGMSIGANAQGRGQSVGHSSTTVPVSAVALATVVQLKTGPGLELDLLIVWRGTPGWFLKGSSSRESSGGSSAGFGGSMSRGGVDLDFQLVARPRSLTIQGAPVELGPNNVVLVDDVDGSQGLKVASVLSISRDGLDDYSQIATVLSRSPEVVAFLKCGLALESPGARAATERVCKEIGRN